MARERVGDFEITDVYDILEEEFEQFKYDHDDFTWWQEDETPYTEEEYRWNLFGDLQPGQEFTVTKYFGNGEKIVIPDKATQLSSGLFEGNGKIKSVIIPDSVKIISDSVFKNCTALEEVKFGKGIEDIYADAFSGCTALKEIDIPKGLTSIRNGVFSKCSALTQVVIPDNIERIGESTFADCASLSSVHLGSGLKRINYYAFRRCKLLKSITLPQSLEVVHLTAFLETGIEELYLPKNVSDIGNITSCKNLKKIEVDPENPHLLCKDNCVISRYSGMLYAAIGKYKLPDDGSIKMIFHWGLYNNPDLTEIDIPEGVTKLYSSALELCKNLRRVTLPSTLEIIGERAFGSSHALEEIVIPGSVKEIQKEAFEFSGIKKLVIKRGVKIIGINAFHCCRQLVEVHIPSSVYRIDGGPFSGDLFKDCHKNLCVYMEKWENGAHKYLARFLGKVKVEFVDRDPVCD